MSVAAERAVLLPYQAAWFDERAPVAIVEKGRRVGISWTEAAACALHAGTDQGNVYYQSFNRDMTRNWIEKAGDWLRNFEVAASVMEQREIPDPDDSANQVLIYRIRLDNGRVIEALESSPRAIRSKGDPGDRYVLDEAAFVGPGTSREAASKHLAEVLKSALAVPMWGGLVRIISTHNGDENPFAEYVAGCREGRLPWSLHRVTFDDAIAQGLVERICEVSGREVSRREFRRAAYDAYPTREQAEEELQCVPRRSSGIYFPRHLVKRCMAPLPRLSFAGNDAFNDLPPELRDVAVDAWLEAEVAPALRTLDRGGRHVFGFDFARSAHLSVLAVLALGEPLRCRLMVEIRNCPHAQQARIIAFVADRLPRFGGGCMDATGAGGAVAEATADRFAGIEQVTINLGWYREWMPHYKGLLESESVALPDSEEVLDDHRAVELVGGVPKVVGGSGGRHGDSVIALVMAAQAAAADPGPFAHAASGRRSPSAGGGEGERTPWADVDPIAGGYAPAGRRADLGWR